LLGFTLAVGGFKLNKRTLSLNDSVQSIAEERNLLEAVLESMNEGVIMFNTSGHAARANQAALALLKLERTASPNQLQAAVIACGIIDLINQTQQNPVSKELEWGEQNTQYILAQAAPLKNEEGVVVVLHDVTHIRILERVRKDFVANVSHELRTPVSIIQANSETLLDGAKDDPAACAMFLEAIQRNSERMGAVISDLLDISRIEAGQMPMALKAVDLDDEVQHVIQSLSQKISSNQVQLKAVIPDKTLVRADQTSLNQILFNLINNAIQYTSNPAQIWIEATLIQAPEIQLKKTDPKDSETKQLNHNMVRIEVKDNGPGIAPEHQTRLFERFYRVDKGRTRNMGGTGLGLSIVKNLVETMQGEVGIKNNTPCGTIFWFELPEA
jgi:two-component system phosphate regulon sensor histidine kinase PhoR